MLRNKLFIAASMLAASPAIAAQETPSSFQAEGQRYEYFAKMDGDLIRIDGTVVDGDKFSLLVAPSGSVRGHFGGQRVSYSVKKTVRDRLAAKLAAEQGLALADASTH